MFPLQHPRKFWRIDLGGYAMPTGPTTASLDDRLAKLAGEVHQIAIGIATLEGKVKSLDDKVGTITGLGKFIAGLLTTALIAGAGAAFAAIRWSATVDARDKLFEDRLGQIQAGAEKPGRAIATDDKLSLPDLRKAIHEEVQGAVRAMPKPEP